MSLANYLHIKHNEYTIPPIITSTENMNNAFSEDNGDQYCEINDSSNELNLESISLTGNAALEVACLLSNFPDIQYIQNSQVVPVAFQPFQLFIANNVLDITAILEIRKSHDAFSHNLQSNFTNSQQIINTNNKILKNPNLRSVWVAANSENNDAAFWSKVSQLGLSGAFDREHTFVELINLMVKINEKKSQNKKLNGL
ncbi:2255_t:CDS:2 [Entrophospora sp. SA101]|nr:2255_t:CDS:2 [Entrophospora sp. SA101]